MDIKGFAKIFKALSNENRLELFFEIVKKNEASFEDCNECMVTDIMSTLNIGAPTVSHHLKELTNANLIITERKGKFLVARINEETMREVSEILSYNPKGKKK